ncbi:hypothetical protein KKE60_04290 [Patescibacteria group bacterium]|nr:hypothetical protein [Patescibacteria group bacterium]
MAIRHVALNRIFQNETGTLSAAPGVAYVEFDQSLRTSIDFSAIRGTRARVLITAQGNEAGAGKGIEIFDSGGAAQLCEVIWNGAAIALNAPGAWTAFSLNLDTGFQVRVKGSSATENITVYTVDLQIEYY